MADEREQNDPPPQYVGSLELSKRRNIEQRLEFWAKERDRLRDKGRRKRALYYQGKLTGGLETLDLLTNNPEYVGWLRRRLDVD
jgi:hypothetical protein